MKKIFATALLPILALAFAACGGGYNPPPDANTKKLPPSQKPAAIEADKPIGPSYVIEYKEQYDLQKAAYEEFRTAVKAKDEDGMAAAYAKQGTHLYKGLWFKITHERNKNKLELLYDLKGFQTAFSDWKKSFGMVNKKWQDDPDFKAAKEAYDSLSS